MKYSKEDLLNEGWASMETLLNKEMPTDKKDNSKYLLVILAVLFAFGIGMWTGTQIPADKGTAEVNDHKIKPVTKASQFSMLHLDSEPASSMNQLEAVNKVQASVSKVRATTESVIPKKANINREKNTSALQSAMSAEQVAQHTIEKTQSTTTIPNFSFSRPIDRSLFHLGMVSVLPFKEMISEHAKTSYLPRITNEIKNKTKWVLGLGLNTGVNVDRNTKVLSINSDWMYKIGKQNAIGVQFLYAAEDEFGFFPKSEDPKTNGRPQPTEGRNNGKELTQNSRQYRFAAGLVVQQEIGYRFYSNFALGFDMLQNSYSEDVKFKSLVNSQDIQYHFGGYTSLAVGYRLSKLVDLEISGTKSVLLQDAGIYRPGNSDHIVGGIKISF